MAVFLVEIVTIMNKLIYTEFVTEQGEFTHMNAKDTLAFLVSNHVENASVVNGKVVLVPNDYSRYCRFKPTVLTRITGMKKGYRIYMAGNGVGLFDEEKAYEIVKEKGASNAKAVERDGRKIVSALEGTFPDEVFKPKRVKESFDANSPLRDIGSVEGILTSLVPEMEKYYELGKDRYLAVTGKGEKLTYLVDIVSKKVIGQLDRDGSEYERNVMDVASLNKYTYMVLFNKYRNGNSTVSMFRIAYSGKTEHLNTSEQFKSGSAESIVGRSKLDLSYNGDFFIPIMGLNGFNIGYYYGNPILNKYYFVEWKDIKCSEQGVPYFKVLDTTHYNTNTGMYTDIKALLDTGDSRDSDIYKIKLKVKIVAVRYRKIGSRDREVLWETVVNKETAKKYDLVNDGVISADILNHSSLNIINVGGWEPKFEVYGIERKQKYYFIFGVGIGLQEKGAYIQRLTDSEHRYISPKGLKEKIEDGTIVNLKIEAGKIVPITGEMKDYFVKPLMKVLDKKAKNRDDRYEEINAPQSSMILLGRAEWDDDLYIVSSYYASGNIIRALTEKQLVDRIGTKDKHNISNYWNVDGHLEISGGLCVITKEDLAGALVHDAEFRGTNY